MFTILGWAWVLSESASEGNHDCGQFETLTPVERLGRNCSNKVGLKHDHRYRSFVLSKFLHLGAGLWGKRTEH
jgi:hypothetical protein